MEEKSENVQATEKIDPFTKFMFGERKSVRREQESVETNNEDEEENEEENKNLHARERDWLFGVHEIPAAKKKVNGDPSILDLLSNVDYIELMHHVDTFMTSTKELKPLVRKLKPYLEAFLNKK